MTPDEFIQKWKVSQGREETNSGPFLTDLCLLLDLPTPGPWTGDFTQSPYIFEAPVNVTDTEGHASTKKIDLYRRDCFILEAKQATTDDATDSAFALATTMAKRAPKRASAAPLRNTSRIIRNRPGWRKYLDDAKKQAEAYARNLPPTEKIPPLIIVSDIGFLFEVYNNFRDTARAYEPLPLWNNSHAIRLDDLAEPKAQELFRKIWENPRALDPTARQTAVTRSLARKLGQLAAEFDKDRAENPANATAIPSADSVADFLIRSLFTMYAEDVGLLPDRSFTNLLAEIKEDPDSVAAALTALWREMNTGGWSATLRCRVPRFNGRVFADATAIPVNTHRMDRLIEAARCDWSDVDPSIFGSLLENALDTRQRSAQGAHYTPRAYVERLVRATMEEPLLDEWDAVKSQATADDDAGRRPAAVLDCHSFLRRLGSLKILDPACGTGNFLVVAFERLKTLEADVLRFLRENLEDRTPLAGTHRVKTTQFLGIEVNPRAARIAELVLNLSALQWFYRHRDDPASRPPEPIIPEGRCIECRDAVLTWASKTPLYDDQGCPRTRWDGFTLKTDPVTGREIPDDSARVLIETYAQPQPAAWPEADFIVGNPPFVGGKDIRVRLGDGYVEALWAAHPELPNSCDFVMYWWHKAAVAVRSGRTRRFGLITTNSITQTFSRRVLELHLKAEENPLSLLMAIPDHPWTEGDKAAGDKSAAVRIAMTVGVPGDCKGELKTVTKEIPNQNAGEAYEVFFQDSLGKILPDLTIGADISGAKALISNYGISNTGVKLHGAGFIVSKEEAYELGLGKNKGLNKIIKDYRHGKDLNGECRNVMVIDLDGLDESEVLSQFPEVYQRLYNLVKPERDQNNEPYRKKCWWLFGRKNTELRNSLEGLSRYIATSETSKYRTFQFLDISILPDNMLVNIAIDDAYCLGVLSSKYHVFWALAQGGILGPTPRYNKTRCFETFPFPEAIESQKEKIREIAERLDAHRKRQQALHPDLTLTEMYNALEALRSGLNLHATDAKGKKIHAKLLKAHDQGLVSLLKKHHDDLDTAVAEAYNWPPTLPDPEILHRLVNLNTIRHHEEQSGLIRWLRPEYQNKPKTEAEV